MKPIVRCLTFALTVVLLFASTSQAQRPDPNSPRYKGVTRIAKMLKTTGNDALKEFVKDYVSDSMVKKIGNERLLELLDNTRRVYGQSDPKGARPVGPFSAKVVFSDVPKGVSDSIEFSVEEKEPFRFVDISLVAAKGIAPASSEKMPLTDADMVDAIKEHMSGLVDKDEFSGAVLLAKNGKPLFQQAYGLASMRFDIPSKIDTKFNLGSMNKMFTGVAICQLVEQGKLSFDDKVIKHLPDYPNREVAEKVTIHQLLTHTSGMGSYFNEKYAATWTRIRTLDALLPTFVDDVLLFEPGAEFGYSNCGPVVLGLIIERLTGQTYFDYVRDHIHTPTGMTNTDCYAMDQPIPNLAIGYTNLDSKMEPVDGPRRNNLYSTFVKGGPAGGGYSTVEDMLKFSRAIQNHELLGPEMTKTLLTGKVAMGPGMQYAYLFGDINRNGHRGLGHNGGGPGISTDFRFYPKLGYTYVVLGNYDGVARGVGSFISGLIERAPSDESPK